MSRSKPLPVLMPRVAGQRWSCHSCTRCCRELVVHLFDEDRRKIDDQAWNDKLGAAPYVKAGGQWVLNKRSGGACVFLDDDGLCSIHRAFGAEAKPLACRMYPFSVRPVREGWQASLRFDCPSAASSKGQPLSGSKGWLQNVVADAGLPHAGRHEPAPLRQGDRPDDGEARIFVERVRAWIGDAGNPMPQRLVGLAHLTLTAYELKRTRMPLAQLIGPLSNAVSAEAAKPCEPPTARQRGMLRQLAFAHAEHLSLHDLRGGRLRRLARRFRQLRAARAFRRGRGPVPPLPGASGRPEFETVEAVRQADADIVLIDDLIARYLTARLAGQSVFGAGYYGWSVLDGLAALCLSVAAAGWLARYNAACESRQVLTFDDVAWGIGAVDRGATRLPALGSFAERARVAYLRRDDGMARLLDAYYPTSRQGAAP